MIYLAIVLGAWLFYVFVSREHKAALFKGLGVITGLILIFIVLAILNDMDSNKRRKEQEAKQAAEQAVQQAKQQQFIAENMSAVGLGVSKKGPQRSEAGVMDWTERNEFSAKICNRNRTRLLRYELMVDGYDPAKSSRNPIGSISPLQGDVIVPAGQCRVASWSGTGYSLFTSYPKYDVSILDARWE